MTREAGTAPRKDHAWHLVLGLALWFAWFCATYGGLAAACSVAPPPPGAGPLTWLNAVALLVAAVCTAGFGGAAWACARAARQERAHAAAVRRRFIARSSAWLYAIAALSTALVALPAVLLPPCV
ncbi:hypothetical protein [Hydrogenophaga laconesensis]|uniref:Lipoprotein n=1 Tax=Hydrogenophaga laconesensis TaxID=1805971 RepID=A0ABU1V7M0_9BURK|nr:hypothetical protein [Hydrogenophaga laconesensis]MDR7093454.1 hypothetical protein [Hydrogenophaga laconesensis]